MELNEYICALQGGERCQEDEALLLLVRVVPDLVIFFASLLTVTRIRRRPKKKNCEFCGESIQHGASCDWYNGDPRNPEKILLASRMSLVAL